MATEGVPKVDTVNFIYFVPGVIFVGGALFGIGICQGWFATHPPDWLRDISPTAFTVALVAVSYVAGYVIWGLADYVFKGWSERFISRHLLKYICGDRPLRIVCNRKLRDAGYESLADFINAQSRTRFFDEVEDGQPGAGAGCGDPTNLGVFGRRLRMFLWNSVYARANPYFIGRFLSSWNNVKYVKATGTSFAVAGAIILGCAGHAVCAGRSVHDSGSTPVGIVLLILALIHWIPLARWRLRVYARDLAHGIAEPRKDTHSYEG